MAEEVFFATGKRKTAVARVYMRPGIGKVTINKRPMEQYVTPGIGQDAYYRTP